MPDLQEMNKKMHTIRSLTGAHEYDSKRNKRQQEEERLGENYREELRQ
jgi:hypothetical protein